MPTISAHHAQLRKTRAPAAPGAPSAHPDPDAEPPGVSYLHGHTAAVHGVDLSVDQRLLLSASSDGTLRLWGAEFGCCLAEYHGHVHPVWDASFCPVGHLFASGGADRVARVWVSDRTAPLRLLAGHGGDVDVVRWHANGTLVATGSGDRSVRLWDLREGRCVRWARGVGGGAGYRVRVARWGGHAGWYGGMVQDGMQGLMGRGETVSSW